MCSSSSSSSWSSSIVQWPSMTINDLCAQQSCSIVPLTTVRCDAGRPPGWSPRASSASAFRGCDRNVVQRKFGTVLRILRLEPETDCEGSYMEFSWWWNIFGCIHYFPRRRIQTMLTALLMGGVTGKAQLIRLGRCRHVTMRNSTEQPNARINKFCVSCCCDETAQNIFEVPLSQISLNIRNQRFG